MKRSFALVALLAAGFALSAPAETTPSSTAPAGSLRIAIIAFQAAVGQTNEFQRDFADLQKKFDPQRQQLKGLSDEIGSLTKQLQAQGAQLSEAERASRARAIDSKKKQAQRVAEDAQNDFQQQMQDMYSSVASKVSEVLAHYAQQQGYTLVVDVTQQPKQAPAVLYWSPSTDITKTVIDAYNVKSGVPAPPAQPAAAKPPAGR